MAAKQSSVPPTRAPITYVIDYARKYLEDDANIRAFADAPPDLMHVGKTVPILHNWGPVPLDHGENQRTGAGRGLHRENIRLLSPAELEERIAFLRTYTKKWHDVGVRMLMPYSSFHTIAGDHRTREGFWAFYDRWDDYAKWLGPRPDADPIEWQMRDRQGGIVPGACGGASPEYYAPLHRYRCCPENPHWRRFQARLTELIAEVGYDGVFPDNSSIHNVCFCAHCQAEFRRFVRRTPRRELALLGLADPKSADLLREDMPEELVRRFRIDTCSRWQEWIRESGRKVDPDFKVFPNINSFEVFMPISAHCDFLMFESTYMPGYSVSTPPPGRGARFAAVEVGAAQALQPVHGVAQSEAVAPLHEFYLSDEDRSAHVALAASVRFPGKAAAGQSVELSVRVEKIGFHFEDAYRWAENFALVLTDAATGAEDRVPLSPAGPIAQKYRGEALRPPVELRGAWTPPRAGRYRLALEHDHSLEEYESDEAAPVRVRAVRRRSELEYGGVYDTHTGQFLFTMHAGARTLSLDYECRAAGREPVQELVLAENAAFTNGSTTAAIGEPLKKYARFFRRCPHLYEGFVPYADIGLLYSFWGFNPETLAYGYAKRDLTPSVVLSMQQRLIQVLMDRTLLRADLRRLRTLILCGHRLEMSERQVRAISGFAARDGALYVCRLDTRVNARPVAEVFPQAQAWSPDEPVPGHAPLVDDDGWAQGLRFNALFSPADRRMILHVVNFNVLYREVPAHVVPVEGITVRLPLPRGWKTYSVVLHDPDTEAAEVLSFAQTRHALEVPLPPVRIYKVLDIRCE